MNERIKMLRERALKREYGKYRNEEKSGEVYKHLTEKLHNSDMSDIERMAYRFEYLMNAETPVILNDEKFVFTRTITKIPHIYSDDEMNKIKNSHHIHELGYVCNICPDYAEIIEKGLNYKLEQIENAKNNNAGNSEYAEYLVRCIKATINLSQKSFRIFTKKAGCGIIKEKTKEQENAKIPK